MTDLVTFGEAMLRYSPPDETRLETADTLEVRVAGAESNVATAAARVGAEATWISKLPDSPLGRRVTSYLHGFGLDTDIVWTEEGRQGTYYIEFGGEPRGTNVIYDRADAAVTTATPAELPTDQIQESEMFATSGITPALSTTLEETTAALLDDAQDAGTTTVFDLNYRSKLWEPGTARESLAELLPAVDVLVTAERDAKLVLEGDGTAEAMTREIASDWGCEAVILTQGAAGAAALAGDEFIEQPAYEADTRDPIGAGDAFLGALLGRYLRGGTWREALEYGAAAAALKLTIPGDIAVITPAEVEAVIEADGGGIDR